MVKVRHLGRGLCSVSTVPYVLLFLLIIIIKLPLAIARAASCNGPVHLSVCPFVCHQNAKKIDLLKIKQFRAMVSIDEL